MLRRRIFSSAMASVMALSSVAVVANAEETAVANYKTKADLEAYVKSFDGFRENGLYDYGSISGEDFLNAIEYAENVIADVEANNDDYTVAYDMLEATYNALTIYSAEELKALIDSCTAIYERGNIYNEELNDEIYSTDSFSNFEVAYDDAVSVLDSNDSRVITDAYEVLDGAKKALAPNFVVTKAQFRAALKEYETMLAKQYKYESWRRGAFSGDWITLPGNGNYWFYQNGVHTYGIVYDYLAAWQTDIYAMYDVMDRIKTLNKTSDESIVAQYKKCVDAPVLLDAWIADDTDRATKNSVAKLLDEYHGLLVRDYAYDAAMELYDAVVDAVGKKNLFVEQMRDTGYTTTFENTARDIQASGADEWVVYRTDYTVPGYNWDNFGDEKKNVKKDTSASLNVKCVDDHFSIPVNDKTGYYDNTQGFDVIKGVADRTTIERAKAAGITYKKISKKTIVDLSDYIAVKDIKDAVDCEKQEIRLAAATTTSGDVIADVNDITSAATKEVAAVADAISDILKADTGASVLGKWTGNDKYMISEAKRLFKNEDSIKAVEDFMAKYMTVLNDALKLMKKYGLISAADATLSAAGVAALDDVEEIKAVIETLKGYSKEHGKDNGDLINKFYAIPSVAEEYKKMPADNNFWHIYGVGDVVDAIIAELNGAAKTFDNAADVAFAFIKAAKSEEAKTRTETHNADINGVVDGGYVDYVKKNDDGTVDLDFVDFEQNGWNITIYPSTSNEQFYVVDLEKAFDAAMFYLNTPTKDQLKSMDVNYLMYYFSTNDDIVDGTANGSSAEWTLVYRYLKYALEDKYGTSAGVHTKAEVKALIEECYELADLTGDASLFAYHHDLMVDTREAAVNWVKEADKDKKYKDNTIAYEYKFAKKASEYLVATDVYTKLKGAYDALWNDYLNFKYSFQEIHDKIAEAEDMIDCGDLEETDALIDAINKASYDLSVIDPLLYDGGKIEFSDNDAFTSDRFFQGFNRLYTHDGDGYELALNETTKIKFDKAKDGGINSKHYALKISYEALLAEINAQTEVTVLKGDVNGDGVVNAFDASALLKNIVNTVAMDAAVADYDNSGVVNALDASAILKAIVNA